MKKSGILLAFMATGFALSGCIPALVTAGATTTGVVASQERSTGNAVDDEGIKLTLDNLFFNRDINDLFKNVTIDVIEGRVMLTGDVDRPETKDNAEKLAWKAKGVKEVINEIQINDQTGVVDYARDASINTAVKSRLLFEKNVRSVNYKVETVNGVVYVIGIAQDQDELNKVTYLCGTTKYVKQVISHAVFKDDMRRRAYIRSDDSGNNTKPLSHPNSQSSGQPESYDDSKTPGGGQPETYHPNQQQ